MKKQTEKQLRDQYRKLLKLGVWHRPEMYRPVWWWEELDKIRKAA